MQFFHRIRHQFRSLPAAARDIRAATQYLMRHVGMTGRVECLSTRDMHDRVGFVLQIHTWQHIPHAAREDIQHYFRRKLTELGELKGAFLLMVIHDADDLTQASHVNRNISSGRVASIVAAANLDRNRQRLSGQELEQRRRDVRRRTHERRELRLDSDYMPLAAAPLTDLGALSPT